MSAHTFTEREALNLMLGQGGAVVETGTTAVTGDFMAIYVIADATFSLYTDAGLGGDALTGFAVPATTWLYGHITAFTLTSGKVIAYKRPA